jgi:hypothetical protein
MRPVTPEDVLTTLRLGKAIENTEESEFEFIIALCRLPLLFGHQAVSYSNVKYSDSNVFRQVVSFTLRSFQSQEETPIPTDRKGKPEPVCGLSLAPAMNRIGFV